MPYPGGALTHPPQNLVAPVARLAAAFTMTTAATVEDVTGMAVTFTFDGRPVNILGTPGLTNQDQASIKLITLTLCRSTDNAIQATTIRQTTASASEVQSHPMPQTGPITAWPSDGVAFVVGTSYTVKLRLLAGSSSKATLNGLVQPCTLYVVTC